MDPATLALFDDLKVSSSESLLPAKPKTVAFLNQRCWEHRSLVADASSEFELPTRLDSVKKALDFLHIQKPEGLEVSFTERAASLNDPWMERAHTREHWQRLKEWCQNCVAQIQETGIEFPPGSNASSDLFVCPETLDAVLGGIGAAYDAVDHVCQSLVKEVPSPSTKKKGAKQEPVPSVEGGHNAFVAIRPPGHHACHDVPMGFCFANNVICAGLYAHEKYDIERIAILDIDLHHGNGTQELAMQINDLQQKKKLKVFYGSIHDILSYPTEMYEKDLVAAASLCLMDHGQYIWNVHLEKFSNKAHFQKLYQEKYLAIVRQAEAFFSGTKPEKNLLIISAGFDAHVKETPWMQRHGRNVPDHFYHEFTEEALKLASKTCKGKVLSVLEGGYSEGALVHGVSSHVGALMGLPIDDAKFRLLKSPPVAAGAEMPATSDEPRTTRSKTGANKAVAAVSPKTTPKASTPASSQPLPQASQAQRTPLDSSPSLVPAPSPKYSPVVAGASSGQHTFESPIKQPEFHHPATPPSQTMTMPASATEEEFVEIE